MNTQTKNSSRKKFILGGLSVLTALTGMKLLTTKKKKAGKVKMLTEDGKLVEVDSHIIIKTGERVSEKEIHTWVKNKPTL